MAPKTITDPKGACEFLEHKAAKRCGVRSVLADAQRETRDLLSFFLLFSRGKKDTHTNATRS